MASVAMYRNILHISSAFYHFYHFLYWNLSVAKWFWPRCMQLFWKSACCDFIRYDTQGADCDNEYEGDGGDCDRKYHNEKRKKVEREEKEQEVSQGSEFHDFDNDNNDDKHDMMFIEV